jgi:hypothetical protein
MILNGIHGNVCNKCPHDCRLNTAAGDEEIGISSTQIFANFIATIKRLL